MLQIPPQFNSPAKDVSVDVTGRLTVFGQVNHLGAELQAPKSAQPEPSLRGRRMSTQRKLGVNRHIT